MPTMDYGNTNLIDLNGATADGSLAFPYQALQAIVNATWALGNTKSAALDAEFIAAQQGFLDVTTAPTVSAGAVAIPTVTAPNVSIPATIDMSNVLATFDTKFQEIGQWLLAEFGNFKANNFGNADAIYAAGESWIQEALQNPNAGLPLAVQQQILEDDRSRILDGATRAADAMQATFAARRFPLPPGQLAGAVLQIQQKSQDEMAETSRKIALMSVENMKFAVEKALTLKQMLLDKAIEFTKALAISPNIASSLIGVGYDAQSKLISAASTFYTADTQAKEMVSKVEQYNNSLTLEAAEKNQSTSMALTELKLRALVAKCQFLATEAAALFNNMHTSAGTSGSVSDSNSTSMDLTP